MANKKILLIGDNCIDEFIYTKCTRFCPEAPVPVLDIEVIKENPGMAGNVYENLKAFGLGVEFIHNDNYKEVKKSRIVDNATNHMFLRVDYSDNTSPIDLRVLTKLDFSNYEAVVISDYCKGFVSEAAIKLISKLHPLTFLDTKKVLGEWAAAITYIKINESEYKNNVRHGLRGELFADNLIVTLGAKGCRYRGEEYSSTSVDVKDVSGAGDSFLSGLIYKYLETRKIDVSLRFANRVARSAVAERGVSIVKPSNLLELF